MNKTKKMSKDLSIEEICLSGYFLYNTGKRENGLLIWSSRKLLLGKREFYKSEHCMRDLALVHGWSENVTDKTRINAVKKEVDWCLSYAVLETELGEDEFSRKFQAYREGNETWPRYEELKKIGSRKLLKMVLDLADKNLLHDHEGIMGMFGPMSYGRPKKIYKRRKKAAA